MGSSSYVLYVLISVLVLISSCKKPSLGVEHLRIAAAANLQFALEEIKPAFEAASGIVCELTYSSSGKLTAQIREGAPFDLFLSADMKYPEELYRRELAYFPPEIYAKGVLVLWSVDDRNIPELDFLTNPSVKHIALPNPKLAPYGLAAVEIIHSAKLEEHIQDKLVYGESISQTNQFISSGAAQVGFTSKSSVVGLEKGSYGRWTELNPKLYSPIEQGILILNNHPNMKEQSEAFRDFIFSPEGKEILQRFGYLAIDMQ